MKLTQEQIKGIASDIISSDEVSDLMVELLCHFMPEQPDEDTEEYGQWWDDMSALKEQVYNYFNRD